MKKEKNTTVLFRWSAYNHYTLSALIGLLDATLDQKKFTVKTAVSLKSIIKEARSSDATCVVAYSFSSPQFNKVKNNNIISCDIHASFENSSFNRWLNNYWEGHLRFLPKRIDGTFCLPWNNSIYFRWMNFDWRPANEPFDILESEIKNNDKSLIYHEGVKGYVK